MSKRCGAKTKSGGKCTQWGMPNGRCRLHGGKTPSGLASPHFKHGRYSKVLRGGILETYKEAVSMPDLLELSAEVGLIDARIRDVLSRTDSSGNERLWSQLGDVWNVFKVALANQDAAGQLDAIELLDGIVIRGRSDAGKWAEVIRLIENRRRLVESETKRAERSRQTVTIEAALFYLATTIQSVKESVQKHADPDTARKIIVDASIAHRRAIGAPTDPNND